jgi:hypothetical protein
LEDIEFAEKRNHMQRKLHKLKAKARKKGLKRNVKEAKIVRNRNEQNRECRHRRGAVIEKNGESKADVLTRISKAQQAFNQLGGIWRTNVVSADPKVKMVKMFNCTIKSVLLYGAWKVDEETTHKQVTKEDTKDTLARQN